MQIKSDSTRRVWIDGELLSPQKSFQIRKHSPDGFNWGYSGSGPAQLALALIIYAAEKMEVSVDDVLQYYQELKWEFVAKLPPGPFSVEFDLLEWTYKKLTAQETIT
jgi:hypothetical protein